MKYEIGDLVSKPVTGICKIEDILYLTSQDEKNNKLYYLMKPIEDEKDKIYVPVSNSDSRLRLCLTKEEAWNLIKRIPEIPTAWINNEKMRWTQVLRMESRLFIWWIFCFRNSCNSQKSSPNFGLYVQIYR